MFTAQCLQSNKNDLRASPIVNRKIKIVVVVVVVVVVVATMK